MKSYRDQILKGNLWRVMLIIALPVALNNFIQAFYNIVDTYLAVSIGSVEVAAITFSNPINQLVDSIANGIAIAGTALMARKIGANEMEEAKKICGQLIIYAIALGTIIGVIGLFYAEEVLKFFGGTADIVTIGGPYLMMIMLTAPFTFLLIVYIAYKRSSGDTRGALYISLVSMGMKVILSMIFIKVMHIGLIGLGMGLFFTQLLVSTYILYDLFWVDSDIKIHLHHMKAHKKLMWTIFIVALPVCIEKSTMSIGHIIANKYIVSFGEVALAGLGITNRINSLAFSAATGIGAGLGIIVGQTTGNKDYKRAKQAIKIGTVWALVIGIILTIVQLGFRSHIATFFSEGDQNLYRSIMGSMIIVAPSIVFWSLFQIVIGTFQGVGKTKFPLIISLARLYVLRVPLIILFIKVLGFGEEGVWYAMFISNAVTALIAWVVFFVVRKSVFTS